MAELQAGGDLFRRLTSVWHRKALDDVTKEEREQTKQSELQRVPSTQLQPLCPSHV